MPNDFSGTINVDCMSGLIQKDAFPTFRITSNSVFI